MEKKKSIKKKITTTITLVEDYILSKNIGYKRTFINDELISNVLYYKGSNINGYSLTPLFKSNSELEILKVHNPFWGKSEELNIDGYTWLEQKELPNPEDINLEDIIFSQGSTHNFFDINFDPIPVVIRGDYIEANLNNAKYDLKKLKDHFDSHPNIVKCSEILDIPYYNSGEDSGTKYLQVLVYPEIEWLKDIYAKDKNTRYVFTPYYIDSHPDYLNMRQFLKPNVDRD